MNVTSAASEPRRAPWIPLVEVGSLLAFVALWTPICVGVLAAAAAPAPAALALAACIAALLLADLVSGIGHWLCDRFFDERTPLVGALIVASFREHHADPQALVAHGFAERNGESALVSLPILAAAWLAPDPEQGAAALALHAAIASFTAGILFTNTVHRWAHAPRVPRPVAWLQAQGVLLRPAAHAVHHGGDHTTTFCITTGWLNPVLDRAGFFRALERVVRWFGVRPG